MLDVKELFCVLTQQVIDVGKGRSGAVKFQAIGLVEEIIKLFPSCPQSRSRLIEVPSAGGRSTLIAEVGLRKPGTSAWIITLQEIQCSIYRFEKLQAIVECRFGVHRRIEVIPRQRAVGGQGICCYLCLNGCNKRQ